MGLSRARINGLVKKAFTALGDVPITLTYTFVVPGVYDPATDAITSTNTVVTNVPAVPTKLKSNEVDWFPADVNTQRLLIAAVDLPSAPTTSDYVTIDDVVWSVRRITQVPGNSLYIIFVQEP